MADAISYRGPDDAGVWSDDEAGLTFAHRRLAVIDVSAAGHQPMLSACGRYVLTFNGEIYNHTHLRGTLEAAGHRTAWRGHSDTETLLAAVTAWGLTQALQRVVGMFALAIWDRQTRTLQLARDRLGEKPLYYAWVHGALVFGSELKAIGAYPGFERKVNRDVLALFMQFGNVPAPYAIFEDVHKLPPGSVLTLTTESLGSRQPCVVPYWSVHETVARARGQPFSCEAEALEELELQLRSAVARQSVADVPLGAFLSGGIDSSLIAALMQEQRSGTVKTYTIGFDDAEYDESPFARAVAAHLGTEHHELRLGAGDAMAVIPLIPEMYDEPFADSSQIAAHLICKAARTEVTVALSGDGGDELFGGYNRYFWSRRIWNVWSRVPAPMRHTAVRAIGNMRPATLDRLGRMFGAHSRVAHLGIKAHKVMERLASIDNVDDLHRLLLTEWPGRSGVVLGANPIPPFPQSALPNGVTELEEAMMLFDTVTYLPDDVLTKVDRAAMSVSLETRVPYLDHHVLETAWRLPVEMKLRDGSGKWALRQLLYKRVPRELLDRPKAGFAVPLGEWLRGPLRTWAESLLSSDRLQREGYLDAVQVRTAWEQHLSGRQDCTQKLWYALMFQSWLAKNT